MCMSRPLTPWLAIATLALAACASFQPLNGSVRDVVPEIGDREAIVIDRAGHEHRLTAVRLENDSVVGLAAHVGERVALAANDVRQIQVVRSDPVTTFVTSNGVMLLIFGAAAALALVAHAASR
jgi:hypothetical protein